MEEETVCQIYPEIFSDPFCTKRIEMGAAKLKKQEEACEILSSSAGSQSVGGLVCGPSQSAAT